MKKTIAIFFILLVMETMGYAQTFDPISELTNTCVVGNSSNHIYADQMNKLEFSEQDSFLEGYKRQLAAKILPIYFTQNQIKIPFTPTKISKDKIYCAMKRIPNILQKKGICLSSSSKRTYRYEVPCVTAQMVDYIHWGFNEALNCYGDLLDNFERKTLFKKINHESAFGFFFQYRGGTGIAQLVSYSKKDMFLPGYAGNNFLINHVRENPKKCRNFVKLLKRTSRTKSLKSCEFLSVGDGIGRSLLGGIGLYLHYRSDKHNPYSAEKLLAYWGVKKSNSLYYKKMRSYITLGMYNKGPGHTINSIKPKIPRGALTNKSEAESYSIIMNSIKKSSFYSYIQSIENSTRQIFNEDGTCKI